MDKEDKRIVCADCDSEFVFSVEEQKFYASKGLNTIPKRCVDCRAQKKAIRQDDRPILSGMQQVACARCGGFFKPPFTPNTMKALFCRSCFNKKND